TPEGESPRRPDDPSTTIVPPRAARQSGISAAPSACATLPPTVPRLRVTKCPTWGERLAQQRMGAGVVLERCLADRGADPDGPVRLDPVEAGAVEVDEQRRAHEPHVERGHEALATGDRLRVLAAFLQRSESLFERARGHIVERDRLHA